MQALKISVIVMALAIVGIVVLIVVTLAQRVGSGDGGTVASGNGDTTGFGDLTLPIPEGCVLASAEAADQRLVLRLDGPVASGCQQAVVLDLESGQVLGRVTATPGP